jgi:hypothetical protein
MMMKLLKIFSGEKSCRHLTQPSPGKLLFLLILFNCHFSLFSQIVTGTVFDKDTKNPIGFAYLYFSGTFVGTQTDQNGNFAIDIPNNKSIPLTVSAIGYYSLTQTDYLTDKPLLIYLDPKVYELKEVNISAKSLARRRRVNMILFRNVFLGTTDNAHYCRILNENDITFNYDSDNDTLKAYALKPLHIENKALGYNITYYLDKFEYDRRGRSFTFKGNINFNEDLQINSDQKENYEMNRKNAYLGSRMHFFRALWLDDLKSAKFEVKSTSGKKLVYKDIVGEGVKNEKFLKYEENLKILYDSPPVSSTLELLKEKVFFSGDGYFDSDHILWDGYMASLRIADWLPYEYYVSE